MATKQYLEWGVELKRIKSTFSKEILAEQHTVENAAAFVIEFNKHGYTTTKEKLSQCLTHFKKTAGDIAYDKDKGGWFLTALQKTA